MPGVEAITDSMVLVPVPVVWFGGFQLPDTATKDPGAQLAAARATGPLFVV